MFWIFWASFIGLGLAQSPGDLNRLDGIPLDILQGPEDLEKHEGFCDLMGTCEFWINLLEFGGHGLKDALPCLQYNQSQMAQFISDIDIDITAFSIPTLDETQIEDSKDSKANIQLEVQWHDSRLEFPEHCKANRPPGLIEDQYQHLINIPLVVYANLVPVRVIEESYLNEVKFNS